MKNENPNKKSSASIRQRLLHHLLSGACLTELTGNKLFGTTGIHKRLSELKNEGLTITDEWETGDNGKRYKKYYMTSEQITQWNQSHEL